MPADWTSTRSNWFGSRRASSKRCSSHPMGPDRLQEFDQLEDWIGEARRCLPTGSSAVGFRTSGSTGQRKLVVHGIDVLHQEIESLAAILGDRTRIVSVVPAHHIYGFLFTVLLPLRLGIEVVDVRAHAPPTLCWIVQPGDLLVAVPNTWRMMIGANWPGNIDGASSGAPCPAGVAEGLCSDGLHRLVEIYGSTETSGIGWRDNAQMPFRLFAHLARKDDDTVCRFTHGAARPYQLPDEVSWSGGNLLRPVRRRDGAVQVGGVNVNPEVVRSVLVAHRAPQSVRRGDGSGNAHRAVPHRTKGGLPSGFNLWRGLARSHLVGHCR